MQIKNKFLFFTGIIIVLFLTISYFIKIQGDIGNNYQILDTLLGTIIFHNPVVLIIYFLIGLALIFFSFKRIKIA